MIQCEASRSCNELAAVNMTWLVTAANTKRTGGNFCKSCASNIWSIVSQSPLACSSVILLDLTSTEK